MDAQTGTPLAGADVELNRTWGFAPQWLDGMITGGDGRFLVETDVEGTHFLAVSLDGYVTGTVPLGSNSTPVVVTDLLVELDRVGAIEVHVRDGTGGGPLAGVHVATWGAGGATDAAGIVLLDGLDPGDYEVCAIRNDDGYVNECLGGFMAGPGAGLAGPTVAVTSGSVVVVELALDVGGVIRGRVLDEETSRPFTRMPVRLRLRDLAGASLGSHAVETDGEGGYAFGELPTGEFLLSVHPEYGGKEFFPEIYPDQLCDPECPTVRTESIHVVQGSEATGYDFFVGPQTVVSGRVLDADSGLPVPGIQVVGYRDIYLGIWEPEASAWTDMAGNYEISYLRANSPLRLGTWNGLGYEDRAWPDILCHVDPCDNGTTFSMELGEVRTGVDFALPAGPAIAGRILDQHDGTGVPAQVTVWSGGQVVWSGVASAAGEYLSAGLPPGSYYLSAAAGQDCQSWGAVPCGDMQRPDLETYVRVVLGESDLGGMDIVLSFTPVFGSGFE